MNNRVTCKSIHWDPSLGWQIGERTPTSEDYGAKAVGLTKVPEAWGSPWVVVPLTSCVLAEKSCYWENIADLILQHFQSQGSPNDAGLIIRSSGQDETMDMRGHFVSERSASEIATVSQTMQRIALQSDSQPTCAIVVQRYVDPIASGHLSNEYRHAQRNVDFLFESETRLQSIVSDASIRSFRLQRPVAPPDVLTSLSIQSSRGRRSLDLSIARQLRVVAAWLAAQNLRGHIEWVASSKQLCIVQFDTDTLPTKIVPMSQLALPERRFSPSVPAGKFFKAVGQGSDFSDLRKTRSHALLYAAGAYVPPIYVARNVGTAIRDRIGPFWDELTELLGVPSIIRFDVPLSKIEWTNLPTLGPLSSLDNARVKIDAALENIVARNIDLAELSVVVHQFMPARAAAWSEAFPGSPHIRIDAIWGLPDGLQSFAHDSTIYHSNEGTIISQIRYKDRFVDVGPNGDWVIRRAAPSIARDEVCDIAEVRHIGEITSTVAKNTSRPVRIMWFLDVLQSGSGSKAPKAMPWIVVEVESSSSLPESYLAKAPEQLQTKRKVDLHRDRAITNRGTLARFASHPDMMAIGGRRVLLQPDAATLRDRKFFEDFAAVVKRLPYQWKVLYAGSMLAHAPYQLQQLGIAVLPLYESVQPRRRTYSRKLVRDGIPDRIIASGMHADIQKLNEVDFLLALRQKLVEEALEVVYASDPDELREELADLLTVARALANAGGISMWDEVEASATEKALKRGEFKERLFLRSSGTARGDDLNPGGADVQRLKSGVGLRIPLIPPLLSIDRERVYHFAKRGITLTVSFREQDVDVRFVSHASGVSEESRLQLTLFNDI